MAEGEKTTQKPRGFAAMPPEERRAVCAKGGRNAHASGNAHVWTSAEAKAAGHKGGTKTSSNRGHMSELGKRGGFAKAEKDRSR